MINKGKKLTDRRIKSSELSGTSKFQDRYRVINDIFLFFFFFIRNWKAEHCGINLNILQSKPELLSFIHSFIHSLTHSPTHQSM